LDVIGSLVGLKVPKGAKGSTKNRLPIDKRKAVNISISLGYPQRKLSTKG